MLVEPGVGWHFLCFLPLLFARTLHLQQRILSELHVPVFPSSNYPDQCYCSRPHLNLIPNIIIFRYRPRLWKQTIFEDSKTFAFDNKYSILNTKNTFFSWSFVQNNYSNSHIPTNLKFGPFTGYCSEIESSDQGTKYWFVACKICS